MGWTAWEKVTGPGMEFSDILYEKKHHSELTGGIARVSINRPQKYNAFSTHTSDEMFRAFYDASHDQLIGVVVLTGVGDNFGTGGDVEWEQWGLRAGFYWSHPQQRLLRLCRKPVIAMVKGYCIGGHNHLAYCCDLTIAAENAIFGQNGPRVSSPADGYFVPYLSRVVGAKKARELWMLCRRYSATQALEMGLVNTVVPLERLEEEVDKWCEEILALSPTCISTLKATFDAEFDSLPQLGVTINLTSPDFFDTPEGKEGSAAYMEKRKPNFWKARMTDSEPKSH